MLTVESARALITTSLTDEQLEEVITREESWLSRRIGPLEGERVETFDTALVVPPDTLRLTRHCRDLTLVDDDAGQVDDAHLRGWSDVFRTSGSWDGEVRVMYTPDDEDEVMRALITLVRLTLTESGYAQESAGGYNASSDIQGRRLVRYAAWRSLLRPRVPSSVRIHSSVPTSAQGVGPVAVESAGS